MRWSDFTTAAPELAGLAMDGFAEQHLCLLGTLRANGWPRISANEIYAVDGELLLGMMPASRKVHDLERDARLTVMTPQCDREARQGDVKLYGRAVPVTDGGLRARYADTLEAAIGWRPTEPYPLFAIDLDSASYISFGERRRLLRWTPEHGTERLRHPDDS
jgi:Pyridoxamine 5'-phosphate oxidase